MPPGIDPPAGPAQELTEGEVGAGPIEGPVHVTVVRSESLREKLLGNRGRVPRGHQGLPIRDNLHGIWAFSTTRRTPPSPRTRSSGSSTPSAPAHRCRERAAGTTSRRLRWRPP